MCRILKVSKSGYYAYIKRPESSRARRNTLLTAEIKRIHQETFQVYGYPRITKELPPELKASKHTVYRLMKKNGIYSKTKRKYKATTNSKHNLPVAENLLNREFRKHGARSMLLTDITYIKRNDGKFSYLSMIIDAYTKQILSHVTSNLLELDLVLETVNQQSSMGFQ